MKRQQAAWLLALFGLLLVAGAHRLARPMLEARHAQALQNTLLDLLPGDRYDNQPLGESLELPAGGLLQNPALTYAYRARLKGDTSAVLLQATAKGYEGPLTLLAAVDPQGRLIASKVLRHQETPGLGDRIERRRSDWLRHFEGLSANSEPSAWQLSAEGGQVDQIVGATRTSQGARDALRRTLIFFDANRRHLLDSPRERP